MFLDLDALIPGSIVFIYTRKAEVLSGENWKPIPPWAPSEAGIRRGVWSCRCILTEEARVMNWRKVESSRTISKKSSIFFSIQHTTDLLAGSRQTEIPHCALEVDTSHT